MAGQGCLVECLALFNSSDKWIALGQIFKGTLKIT